MVVVECHIIVVSISLAYCRGGCSFCAVVAVVVVVVLLLSVKASVGNCHVLKSN